MRTETAALRNELVHAQDAHVLDSMVRSALVDAGGSAGRLDNRQAHAECALQSTGNGSVTIDACNRNNIDAGPNISGEHTSRPDHPLLYRR